MRLIVISNSTKFESELKIIPRLFDSGMETFHLRKPKFSARRMNKYLRKFPKEHLNKVVIHTHHRLAIKFKLKGIHITEKQKRKKLITWLKLKILKSLRPLTVTSSFHSISDLMRDKKSYDYVFLSPLFDSISKKGYRSSFNETILKNSLAKCHHTVIAMGGIKQQNIHIAKEYGFSGVAVLGSIWEEKDKDPIDSFKEVKEACSGKNLKIIPLNFEI